MAGLIFLTLLASFSSPQVLGLQLRVAQQPLPEEAEAPAQQPQPEEAKADANQQAPMCLKMPKSKAEWKNSSLWAVLIDGKDAHKGPHVYDWDHKFFSMMTSALSDIYKKEGKKEGKKKLSQELVESFNKKTFGDDAAYDHSVGGGGIMPTCTDKMVCDDVKSLLLHMPEELYTAEHQSKKGCPRGLKPTLLGKAKKEELLELISKYNKGVSKADGKDEKLHELVKFTRSFAMLHPFRNGNGRVKNLILQRELRRLGIACGTMMYNYNKDVLVDGFPRHVRKVEEGIRVFDETVAAKGTNNPWLDEKTVERHQQDFPVLKHLDKCFKKKSFGSGGSVALVYPDRVSLTPEEVA